MGAAGGACTGGCMGGGAAGATVEGGAGVASVTFGPIFSFSARRPFWR